MLCTNCLIDPVAFGEERRFLAGMAFWRRDIREGAVTMVLAYQRLTSKVHTSAGTGQ